LSYQEACIDLLKIKGPTYLLDMNRDKTYSTLVGDLKLIHRLID
jgi:hypothetical protein